MRTAQQKVGAGIAGSERALVCEVIHRHLPEVGTVSTGRFSVCQMASRRLSNPTFLGGAFWRGFAPFFWLRSLRFRRREFALREPHELRQPLAVFAAIARDQQPGLGARVRRALFGLADE